MIAEWAALEREGRGGKELQLSSWGRWGAKRRKEGGAISFSPPFHFSNPRGVREERKRAIADGREKKETRMLHLALYSIFRQMNVFYNLCTVHLT